MNIKLRASLLITSFISSTIITKHQSQSLQINLSSSSSRSNPPIPTTQSLINYSAANEYVASHYSSPLRNKKHTNNYYFSHSQILENIYDARRGIYNDSTQTYHTPTLSSCGFTLLRHKQHGNDNNNAAVIPRWDRIDDVLRMTYLKKTLRQNILPRAFFDHPPMEHIIFWQPMIRGTDMKMSSIVPSSSSSNRHCVVTATPKAPIASMPHIDTDVNAYDISDLMDLIFKNAIAIDDDDKETTTGVPSREDIVNAITTQKRRFAICNIWRNIDDEPIERDPLAILNLKYKANDDVLPSEEESSPCFFPNGVIDRERSRWYTFPKMRNDEYLVFKQYDRDLSFSSDLWHCALASTPAAATVTMGMMEKVNQQQQRQQPRPRRSFDVRAFILFSSSVSEDKDRFREDRRRPDLSLEESGCFCDEQAKRHGVAVSS